MFKFLALLFSLGSLAFSLPYKSLEDLYAYDESDEITVDEDVKTPEFLSKSLNLVVNQGESISLPCSVTSLQGFVLLWKKDGIILSVGDTVLGNAAAHYYLQARENGNNLVISQVEPEDEGEYVCQISAFQPTQIQHTVKIKVRPTIVTSPENNLTVKEGERVELDCDLMKVEKGLQVKWRRIGDQTKFETTNGYILFEEATADQGGAYECVAEDEFGKEIASKRVDLFIEYAPEMKLHQTLIKSVDSEEVHIDCEVRGFPDPDVKWTKNNMPIRNVKERTLNGKNVKSYTLVLSKDEEHHYPEGKFNCEAENAQGSAKESIQMQGDLDSLSESSEGRNQYPRLDIRNFYLERIEDESVLENMFEDHEEDKNDKIEMKKLRVFSYSKSLKDINHLRNQVNTKHESRTSSKDISQETSQDLISSRAKNKAFRGSFSDDADLNEIDGFTKDQDIEETGTEGKEVSTDVGWGWYQKSLNPRLTHQNTEIKNFPNTNVDEDSEENVIYENIPKSDVFHDLTNDDKTQGGHQSQSEPQEKRMGASLGSISSDDMFLTTSIVTTDRGETNLENSSPYEKPFIPKPLPSDINAIDSRLMSQENGGDFDGSSEDGHSTLTLDLLLSSLPESVGTIYKANSGNDDIDNSQTYDDASLNHVPATKTPKVQDIEYDKQKISDADSLIYPHHESQHAYGISTSETKDSKNNKNDDFENAIQNAHFEKDELDEDGIFSKEKSHFNSIKNVDLDRENQISENERTDEGVFVRLENQAVLGSSSGSIEEENYMTAFPKINSRNEKSSNEIDLETKFSSQEFGNKDEGDSYEKEPSSNAIEQGHYMAKISEPFHKDAKSNKEINPEAQYSSQENNENVEDDSNVVDTSFNNVKEEEYHIPTQSKAYRENDKSEAEKDKSNEERDIFINLNGIETLISSQEQENYEDDSYSDSLKEEEHIAAMSNIYNKVDKTYEENDESNTENDFETLIPSQEYDKKDQAYYDVTDSYSSEIATLSNNFNGAKSINDNVIEIQMSSQELDNRDENDKNVIGSSSDTEEKEEYMATLSKSFNENDKFKSEISLETEIPSQEFTKSNDKSDKIQSSSDSVNEEEHLTTISKIYNKIDKSYDENEESNIENDLETHIPSQEHDKKDQAYYDVTNSYSSEIVDEEFISTLSNNFNGAKSINDNVIEIQMPSQELDKTDENDNNVIGSSSDIEEKEEYIATLSKSFNENDKFKSEISLETEIPSQEFTKSNDKSDKIQSSSDSVNEEEHLTTISKIYKEIGSSYDENEESNIENEPENQISSKEYDNKDPVNYEVIDSYSDVKEEEEYMVALPAKINKSDGLNNEIGLETQISTHDFHQPDEDDSYETYSSSDSLEYMTTLSKTHSAKDKSNSETHMETQSSSKEYDEMGRNDLDIIDSTSNIIEDEDYVAILGKAHNEKDQSNNENDLETQISSQEHDFREKTTTADVNLSDDDEPEKDALVESTEVQGYKDIEETRKKDKDHLGVDGIESHQLKQNTDNKAIENVETNDKSASNHPDIIQSQDKQKSQDEKKLNDLETSIEEEKENRSVTKDNQPEYENYVDYSYAEIAEQKKSKSKGSRVER